MNKMTLTLIALFAFVAGNLDAGCCKRSCASSCEPKCIQECEPPQCFQWRKVSVCPEKHIYYTCPEGSNMGGTECTEAEKTHGGSANY